MLMSHWSPPVVSLEPIVSRIAFFTMRDDVLS